MSYNRVKACLLPIVFTILAGCAVVTDTPDQASRGIDGIPCIGHVEKPPAGLVHHDDEPLLRAALGASGDGKLCTGKVFRVTRPLTVYRVWNSEKSYTLYGSWWSFTQPTGPRQKYRHDNVICPSWSKLDRMSACTIKNGTKIVIGPGQSANCEKLRYAKSPVNQVFIANDARNKTIHVENCTAGTAWP